MRSNQGGICNCAEETYAACFYGDLLSTHYRQARNVNLKAIPSGYHRYISGPRELTTADSPRESEVRVFTSNFRTRVRAFKEPRKVFEYTRVAVSVGFSPYKEEYTHASLAS